MICPDYAEKLISNSKVFDSKPCKTYENDQILQGADKNDKAGRISGDISRKLKFFIPSLPAPVQASRLHSLLLLHSILFPMPSPVVLFLSFSFSPSISFLLPLSFFHSSLRTCKLIAFTHIIPHATFFSNSQKSHTISAPSIFEFQGKIPRRDFSTQSLNLQER